MLLQCWICILLIYYFIFLQENPSEEDAAIVDKVLSMRLTKKEVCVIHFRFCSITLLKNLNLFCKEYPNSLPLFKVSPGQYTNVEEFFVKYKN